MAKIRAIEMRTSLIVRVRVALTAVVARARERRGAGRARAVVLAVRRLGRRLRVRLVRVRLPRLPRLPHVAVSVRVVGRRLA